MSEIENDIENKVIQVIANLLHLDEKNISPKMLLVEDLGMDSFAAVEMLFNIEDHYGLEIPDEEMMNLRTINDIVGYLDNIILKN